MKENSIFPIGSICTLIDKIDPELGNLCTIRLIEPDEEIEGLVYYYLRAVDDSLNVNFDNRIGSFFKMSNNNDGYLQLISYPTNE